MLNSPTLADEVYQRLVARRKSPLLPGHPLAIFLWGTPKDASLFEKLKIISVEAPMMPVVFHRLMKDHPESQQDINEFIAKRGLYSLNASIDVAKLNEAYAGPISGMGANIAEAAWEDGTGEYKDFGGKENAAAGLSLIALMEKRKNDRLWSPVKNFDASVTKTRQTLFYNRNANTVSALNIKNRIEALYKAESSAEDPVMDHSITSTPK